MALYEVDEEMMKGLVQYLGTRPIQECVGAWAAFKDLKPLTEEEIKKHLKPEKGKDAS